MISLSKCSGVKCIHFFSGRKCLINSRHASQKGIDTLMLQFSSSRKFSDANIPMPTATSIPIPVSYYPIIERSRQLPEINEAMSSCDPNKAIPLLKRGVDIFHQMDKSQGISVGADYRAVSLLLARAQGLNGDHKDCTKTIEELINKLDQG